jgi:hypothetical protein
LVVDVFTSYGSSFADTLVDHVLPYEFQPFGAKFHGWRVAEKLAQETQRRADVILPRCRAAVLGVVGLDVFSPVLGNKLDDREIAPGRARGGIGDPSGGEVLAINGAYFSLLASLP